MDGVFEGVSKRSSAALRKMTMAVLRKFVREGSPGVQRRKARSGRRSENVEFRVWDYTAAVHGDRVRPSVRL